MMATILLLTCACVLSFVMAGMLSNRHDGHVTGYQHPTQDDAFDYERVNDVYLVQSPPDFGPPPPVARLEPVENRLHISEC